MRAVLDTSVLVAAFRSRRGASNVLITLVARRLVIPVATPAHFLQWEEVLKRPEHLAASGSSSMDIDTVLRDLADLIEPVEVRFRWRPQLTDADDELVLEAAVNGQADAIVTFNTRHFAVAAERFGIPVLIPREALGRTRR